MIKLYDSQITDILPPKIASDTEVKCIAYALQKEMQRLIVKADGTRTMTMIDTLPEDILDTLAVELRTPYYTQDMSIETKRDIIKNTLAWHTKAGTPSAVEELVGIVFGEGKVVEWFNYTEAPYTAATFDIITNARMTEDIANYFLQIIKRVKNTRSHIRRILIQRGMDMKYHAGALAESSPAEIVRNNTASKESLSQVYRSAAATQSYPSLAVDNCQEKKERSMTEREKVAAGVCAATMSNLTNNTDKTRAMESMTGTAAAAKAETAVTLIPNLADSIDTGYSVSPAVAAVSYSNISI